MMDTDGEKDQLLREARKFFSARSPAPIWKRTAKPYQANFGRLVRVELTRDLSLRVIDPKSGAVLTQGPVFGPKAL